LYIVEPESRWNDAEGNPIRYAVLDIPIDKNLGLKKGSNNLFKISSQSYDFSNTWRGPIVGYDDILIDNIMVIAAVFDKETDHAVQVTSERPDAMISTNGYTNVTAEESWEMLNNHSTIQYPIDVRTIPEWDLERIDTPAPEDPILYADLQHGVALEEFMEEYADKEVLIYCRSGNRSYIATKLLLDNGFTGKIWQMVGGIKAWQAEGFPTKPKYSVLINVRTEKTESDQGIISIEDNVYPIYDYEAVPCEEVGCYNVELPAGEYDITVSNVEGYKDQTKTVEIEKDEEITFNFPKSKLNLLNLILNFIIFLYEKQNFHFF
jgi:rhodanese-related sulfurtransferase